MGDGGLTGLTPRPPLPSPARRPGEGENSRAYLLYLLLFLSLSLFSTPLLAADRVVVGSKNFEESRLLGEIFAQLLESRTHLQVERRMGLAGTQVCFEALQSGAI